MDNKLAKYYRSSEWKEYRLRIIELDNYTCTKCLACFRDNPSGLHVHHKIYIDGKKPWEYAPQDLTTLCRACHAEEHGHLEKPRFGWSYIGSEDLGDLIGECEYCGTPLRYQHTIYHPDYGFMYVGKNHADELTESSEATEEEEREKRRNKYYDKWIASENNTYICKKFQNHYLEICQQKSIFFLKVDNYRCDTEFRSLREAQDYGFNIIMADMVDSLQLEYHDYMYKSFLELPLWNIDISDRCQYIFTGEFLNHTFNVIKSTIVNSYDRRCEEFLIVVDCLPIQSLSKLADVKTILFNILFDRKQYIDAVKKGNKRLKCKIESWCNWHDDKYDRQTSFSWCGFTFVIPFGKLDLYVKHKDYLYSDKPENHKLNYYNKRNSSIDNQYLVYLGSYDSKSNLYNAVFDCYVRHKELYERLKENHRLYFENIANWSVTQSAGFKNVYMFSRYKACTVTVYEYLNGTFSMKIEGKGGNKIFANFAEVTKIAYDFLISGKYKQLMNKS